MAGAECVIDAASGSARGRRRLAPKAAGEFFTASARNLHEIGQKAGVQRMVEVSVLGIDHFTIGQGAAKYAHEKAVLAGPIPVRVLRAAQFHEMVPQLIEWGTQGNVAHLRRMRIQPVAPRAVAQALIDLAKLFVARRGIPLRIQDVTDPNDPDDKIWGRRQPAAQTARHACRSDLRGMA